MGPRTPPCSSSPPAPNLNPAARSRSFLQSPGGYRAGRLRRGADSLPPRRGLHGGGAKLRQVQLRPCSALGAEQYFDGRRCRASACWMRNSGTTNARNRTSALNEVQALERLHEAGP